MQGAEQIGDIKDLTDMQLSRRVRQGDDAAFDELVTRYLPLVRAKASVYRKMGLETDDLVQEGTVALLGAARTYRPEENASFRTFADICIERRMATAYRSAARQKHIPLNTYISLNDALDSKDVETQMTSVDSVDPETLLINSEDLKRIKRHIEQTLSGLEFKVLSLYLSGRTYEEIAESLAIAPKAVDNALQRVRKKLRKTVS